MMLGRLSDRSAPGVFGRRRLEPTTDENVAGRLRCGDPPPDHDPIGSCRRQHRELRSRRFAPGLELAARGRVLQVGAITVAIDGTKVPANARRHAAVSYARARQAPDQPGPAAPGGHGPIP
ncbi:MAG: hypothetical protein PHE83_07400 [Opitutaceae bacterium]|nr:hypothetical protein [Opitutaceae bacterium]